MSTQPNSFRSQPDERGHFGDFRRALCRRNADAARPRSRTRISRRAERPAFAAEFDDLLTHYVGRPSPLYYAERLTEELRKDAPAGKGAQIWFKRDELNHTGAHKINNCIGQILLARRMGKTRIIAETGAGQHGVATATVCARFGLPCVIYMGARDMERQQPNVFRMKLLGAEVIAVDSGARTLKDAMNEALRDWVANVHDTFYIIGTAAGPHPYPELVRDFQSVIGKEARAQIARRAPGACPTCSSPRSAADRTRSGCSTPSSTTRSVEMLGVEAAGHGLDKEHAASLAGGSPGILHGNRTYLLQDEDGQIDRGAFDQRRARLSRHRPRTCVAARHRPRRIYQRDRHGSARRLPAALPHRRHHPRARTRRTRLPR